MQTPTYHFFIAKYSQLAAYVLLAALLIFGLWRLQSQQESIENLINERSAIRNQQSLELCIDAQVNRQGLRNNISAVADLGRQIAVGDDPSAVRIRERFTAFEMQELSELPEVTCPRPQPEDTAGK